MAASVNTAFGVLGMPMGNLTAKQTIKAAGCTHTVVQAQWSALQPSGPGTALSTSAVAAIALEYAQAAQVGLKVFFELALHYPPAWVLSDVEQFVDQYGNTYAGSSQPPTGGQYVTNWMWTATGWGYVTDLCNKLAAALGPAVVAQTDSIKIGGGYYGELHYAPSAAASPNWSFWGYGTSMQSGTGLASGQVVCPEPGYVLFSGTDAQDSMWLNWYLNGLGKWLMFFAGAMRTAGWGCEYHVCHPGYGVRSNQLHSDTGYRQSAALGEDPARMIGVYAHDPKMWPYGTWLNTSDGYQPAATDSDQAAWKKIYAEALARNKHYRFWGENTGGETAQQLGWCFSGYAFGSALCGSSYPLAPTTTLGAQGMFWLSYSTLTDNNGTDAQMSDLTAAVSAHQPTLTSSGTPTGYVPSSPPPPTNSTVPTVTGTGTSGNTLTVTTGTWTNNPSAYLYQWTSTGAYVGSSGLGHNTYVIQSSDIGKYISCIVTACNSGGSTPVTTATVYVAS